MKTKSEKERVLIWLLNGHTLTPLQALRRYGTLRLGAIIYDLRHFENYDIKTEMIKVGERKWVAKYSLYKEEISWSQ